MLKIEIKSYKECRGDEGNAFSLTLWIDGKRAAWVTYNGNGGCYRWDWDKKANAKAKWDAYIEALPPEMWMGTNLAADYDSALETFIGDMKEKKQLKGWCRTKIVYRLKGQKKGEWNTIPLKGKKYDSAIKELLVKKYGDQLERIVNEEVG